MMRVHPGRATVSFLAAITIAVLAQGAWATPIEPADSSLSLLGALPGGDLTIDTGTNGDGSSTPTLTYGGGTLFGNIVTQAGGPDIAVFLFDGGSTQAAGSMLTVTSGSRPLALLFNGSATLSGTIDVSGGKGGEGGYTIVGGRGVGVAGGANGGAGGPFTVEDGFGPGGGAQGGSAGSQSGTRPGGGGGFGTDGGDGFTVGSGGTSYGGPLSDLLEGGSGGGGGGGYCCVGYSVWDGGSGGGAGGGGVEIGALTLLSLEGADILANGGNGGTGYRSGGGGSGGGILLHAFDISLDSASLLQANGGTQGACGGAGRIEVITNTQGSFNNGGTIEAMGGGDACNDSLLFATSLETIGVASDNGGVTTPPPTTTVPEPGSLGLLGFLFSVVMLRRRRRT